MVETGLGVCFTAEERMRRFGVRWHGRRVLAERLTVKRFHKSGLDTLERIGDGEGFMLR